MTAHPARSLPFRDLLAALLSAESKGHVVRTQSSDGLTLWCYSRSCVYERAWTSEARLARGLIMDLSAERIIATPFPKFFNLQEGMETPPGLPFSVFDKLDGSLAIIFHHAGTWRAATKGSFASEQAKAATAWLTERPSALAALEIGVTYLAEWIAPENRIVVRYPFRGLALLGAYRADGAEFSHDELMVLRDAAPDFRLADRRNFESLAALVDHAKALPREEEGFVIRFENGQRFKVKGDEYLRLHRLVSSVTPLAVWEAMAAGDDLQVWRRELPEEFWEDFDQIERLLSADARSLMAGVQEVYAPLAGLSDKDIGLRLTEFPERVRRFIFPYRKFGGDLMSGKIRAALFREIRPTGNRLAGYEPSSAVNRVAEEMNS